MRVFLINGASQNENALESWLIPSGTFNRREHRCDGCIYDSHAEPYDYLVQGFDDFGGFDPGVPAFLPQTPPFVTSKPFNDRLAELLTGVVAVRVGYNEWNQTAVPPEDWFRIGPRLGGLFVTSVCALVLDENGSPLEKCEKCGQQKMRWSKAKEKISEYRIARSGWPGSDVFLLEGGDQYRGTCLTEAAVEKLNSLGFNNLKLVEMGWAN